MTVEEFFFDSVSSVFVPRVCVYSNRFSTIDFFTRAKPEILFSQYLDLRASQRHQTYLDYRHGHCLPSQRFGFGQISRKWGLKFLGRRPLFEFDPWRKIFRGVYRPPQTFLNVVGILPKSISVFELRPMKVLQKFTFCGQLSRNPEALAVKFCSSPQNFLRTSSAWKITKIDSSEVSRFWGQSTGKFQNRRNLGAWHIFELDPFQHPLAENFRGLY